VAVDNSSCVILVPAAHYIEPHCELSLRQLEGLGYPVRRVYGFSQIDYIRSRMASEALADGYTELMWIDSDMAFEPASVARLRSHGLPLVCGLYPSKVERYLTSHLPPEVRRLTFGQGGGLVEVLYAATGFLYTRRQVYLDLQQKLHLPVCNQRQGKPVVPFFLPLIVPDGGGHWYLGEDYSFCERARQCDYRIFADTTIRLQHIGIYGYSWEDLGNSVPRSASYRVDV
jgi:hypothetical protein